MIKILWPCLLTISSIIISVLHSAPEMATGQKMEKLRDKLGAEPLETCGLRPGFGTPRKTNRAGHLSVLVANGSRPAFGQFPSYAFFEAESRLESGHTRSTYCGATLIGRKHAITATHCLHHLRSMSDFHITLGMNGPRKRQVKLRVTRICHDKRHCNRELSFNNGTDKSIYPIYDLALMELEREVEYSDYIQPACIALSLEDSSYKSSNEDLYESVGMGWHNNWGDRPSQPMFVQMKRKCSQESLGEFANISNTLDCYRATNEANLCHGDSGGPIYYYRQVPNGSSGGGERRQFLAGETSFGRDDCRSVSHPVAFTSLERYEPTMRDMLANNSTCDNIILSSPGKPKSCPT